MTPYDLRACLRLGGAPWQPFPQTADRSGEQGSLLRRSASTVSLLGGVLTQTSSGTRLSVISKS